MVGFDLPLSPLSPGVLVYHLLNCSLLCVCWFCGSSRLVSPSTRYLCSHVHSLSVGKNLYVFSRSDRPAFSVAVKNFGHILSHEVWPGALQLMHLKFLGLFSMHSEVLWFFMHMLHVSSALQLAAMCLAFMCWHLRHLQGSLLICLPHAHLPSISTLSLMHVFAASGVENLAIRCAVFCPSVHQ